jgi:hypothetical protein
MYTYRVFHGILLRAWRGLTFTAVFSLLPLASVWAEGPASAQKAKKAAVKPLQPGVVKVHEVLKRGLDQKAGGFNFAVLVKAKTGSVELFQIDEVNHFHPERTLPLHPQQGQGADRRHRGRGRPGDLVIIGWQEVPAQAHEDWR